MDAFLVEEKVEPTNFFNKVEKIKLCNQNKYCGPTKYFSVTYESSKIKFRYSVN